MKWTDLALLQDIARQGSFAAVARQRSVDPSSIGRMVAAIEADLGFRLFVRTTRRMALTEAGSAYLARLVPISEEIDRLTEECRLMQSEPRGTLRLSASTTFGQRIILPLLPAFRRAYPEVAVEGLFSDNNVDLVSERIDLAIRLAPSVEGDHIVSKLMDTRYFVVASPTYLRGARELEHPEDLAGHRVILFPYRDYRSRWLFRDAAGDIKEQKVDGDIVLAPAGAIRDAVLSGLGPALLPDWLIRDDLETGALVHCIADWDATATSFDTAAWLVYPSRSYVPAKVRAMVEFLRACRPKDPFKAPVA